MKNLFVTFLVLAASIVQVNAQTEVLQNVDDVASANTTLAIFESVENNIESSVTSVEIDYDRSVAMKRFAGYLDKTIQEIRAIDLENSPRFEGAGIYPESTESKGVSSGVPAMPRQSTYVRPTKKQRVDRYVNKMVGTGLISVGFGAVLNQIGNEPEEWEKNIGGFGRRLASGFGQKVIKETIAFGIEESLKLDSKFYKSEKKDVGSRVVHGLLSGFTARRPSGKKVFNPGPIVGSYTSNVVAKEAWYPDRYTYHDGIRSATRGLIFTSLFGLVNEFIF